MGIKIMPVAKVVMILSCLVMLSLAGCGNDTVSPSTGSVSGKIVDSNNAPVAGASISFINNAFKPYTSAASEAVFGSYSAMDAANSAGIVGTTTTNANGEYKATVPNGNYSLVPMSTIDNATIIPTTGPNPATVIVSGNESVVDYTSALLLTADPPRGFFRMNVIFKNLPDSKDGLYEVKPYRRCWPFLFIPRFYASGDAGSRGYCNLFATYDGNLIYAPITDRQGRWSSCISGVLLRNTINPTPSAFFTYDNGSTVVFSTSDSIFYCKVTYTKPDGKTASFNTPKFGFTILQEPSTSSFTYDYSTKKITRTD